MEVKKGETMNTPINDFNHCIEQARTLRRVQESDKRLRQAFSYLAGDSTIGFLAYIIWRGRSNMLTLIQHATDRTPGVQKTPGASLAQT